MRDRYLFDDVTKNDDNNATHLKPRKSSVDKILSFSKSLEIVKTKKFSVEVVLN